MENNSFILYADWKKIFELLPSDQERVMLLYLMFDLVLPDGEEDIAEVTEPVISAWDFLSPKIIENLKKWEDEKIKRSNAGRIGGLASGQTRRSNASKSLKQNEANVNDRSKSLNESEANEAVTVTVTDTVTDTVDNLPTNVERLSEKESTKEKRFKKPSLEELELFILDNSYQDYVNADVFYSFYESKGWKVGNAPMKDWKAAVRGWASRERKKQMADTDDFTLIDWGD